MFDLMKLMSIFSGFGQGNQSPMDYRTPPFVPYGSQPQFGGGYTQSAVNDVAGQIGSSMGQQGYQPERTMQDRFMELINGFPQRDPNPSGWRRFGAVLTGLGGEDAGQALSLSNTALNLPHINAVQDWGMQVKPTLEAAENERLYNQYEQNRLFNERKQTEVESKNAAAQALAAEKLEEEKRQALSREDVARRNVAVREAYQIMRARRDANTHRFFVDKNGMVIGVNVLDPSKTTPTGIDSKELTETQKMDLELEDDIVLENLRHQNRLKEIQTPRPPTTHTTTSGGGTPSATQEKTRVQNRILQMSAERPDLYDWMDKNTGLIKRNTPENIRQEINRYVYNETRPTPGSSVTPVTSGVPFNTPGTKPAGGAVQMRTPDGRIVLVPPDKVAEAEKRGAKRVQ